jgi:predicted GTPase
VVKGIRRVIKSLPISSAQTSSKENFTQNFDASINKIIARYRAKEDVGPDSTRIGKVPVILFAGTATVGKSSLINALFGGQLITVVSPIPQEVETVEELYWARALKLVDSPSYDQSPQEALKQLDRADIIIHIHDIGARRSDAELAKHIQERGKPCIMVLNKCDLYTRERQAAFVRKAKEKWSLDVLCISAREREGLGQLIMAVCRSLPQDVYADVAGRITKLVSGRPTSHSRSENLKSRRDICNEIIEETSEAVTQMEEGRRIGTDTLPFIILYQLMIKRIAKQYFGDNILPISADALLSIPQIAIQELVQLFPTSNAQRWTYYIGLLAIKIFEEQILSDQISQELRRLVRASSQ